MCERPAAGMSFDISRYLVLLAHPDSRARGQLQAKLHAADIDVVLVADGMQAWQALNAMPERYDAVVLDGGLAGLSASELVRRLRECPATAALPAVLLGVAEPPGSASPPSPGAAAIHVQHAPPAEEPLGALRVAIEDYRARLNRAP